MTHDKYCCYCGKEIKWPLVHTWEHIIPVSKGGSNHSKNKRTCCNLCNKFRGNMDLEIWKIEIQFALSNRKSYRCYSKTDMSILIENIGYIQQAIKTATPDMFKPSVRTRLINLNKTTT